MLQKKAAIEVQFNWLFVMIIGGIILLFFVMIVFQQKESSEKELAVELTSQFELIFTGQGVASGSKNEINIPEVVMEFTCDDYSIQGVSRSLGNAVLFAPKTIEGDKMLTLTRAWKMPMLIANFVYITNPDIKYYFVSSQTDFLNETIKAMPANMDILRIDNLDDLDYENNYRVRFVFFGQTSLDDSPVPKEFVGLDNPATALVLSGTPSSPKQFEENIKFAFYEERGGDWQKTGDDFDSYGLESFFGAIITENAEDYGCIMNKAKARLSHVAKIYQGRINLLDREYGCGPDAIDPCCDFFIANFNNLANLQGIYSEIETIVSTNKQAERGSCPTLY